MDLSRGQNFDQHGIPYWIEVGVQSRLCSSSLLHRWGVTGLCSVLFCYAPVFPSFLSPLSSTLSSFPWGGRLALLYSVPALPSFLDPSFRGGPLEENGPGFKRCAFRRRGPLMETGLGAPFRSRPGPIWFEAVVGFLIRRRSRFG